MAIGHRMVFVLGAEIDLWVELDRKRELIRLPQRGRPVKCKLHTVIGRRAGIGKQGDLNLEAMANLPVVLAPEKRIARL